MKIQEILCEQASLGPTPEAAQALWIENYGEEMAERVFYNIKQELLFAVNDLCSIRSSACDTKDRLEAMSRTEFARWVLTYFTDALEQNGWPEAHSEGIAQVIRDRVRQPLLNKQSLLENATEDRDYMAGHCHVMALALKQLHPDWQIRAHVGWDDDAEDDDNYRVDHVYIVAPDGSAYDCRGRFDNEQSLVGPDTTGGVETQFVDYSLAHIKQDIQRGELQAFSRSDLLQATKLAKQLDENFADGRVKGRSRPGRVKRAGASCKGSVSDLRARAKRYGGERGKMYHWCANMKSGKKK
jgi:hypothetical protein